MERARAGQASPTRRGATAGVVAVSIVLALTVGLLARPAPSRLPAGHVGDAALAALAREVVGEDRPALAVAVVTAGEVRTAAVGAGLEDRFEIGSVSKGLTGLLFEDMIERGEVSPETRVGDLVTLDGPVAEVTLAQLATHASGLPPQPSTAGQFVDNFWSSLTAGNPYDGTVAQRLADLGGTELGAPPGTYSNVAFELLGAALAGAAGTPFPRLLAERVLTPIGMSDTSVPVSPADLGPRDLRGETAGGRLADPWVGEAVGPAGGLRANVSDMATLARALVVGAAPGIGALSPRGVLDEDRIGWAWITTVVPGSERSVVWHNGGTGGFTSFIGIDRAAGTAVVLLSAVGEPPGRATAAGFALLERIGGAA
ncbi:serine hydrolase domain-containing protein [Pseudonocardia xinjiangensis]|uniref:serine hydrolase domain-containing protein n=1 Tax=Pseudonocardia xinjiangensis TaxID=75289 RepID=UPI003D91D2CA